MKKISFKTLHKLVSEVDYLWDETYPITFKVDDRNYEIGIGEYCGYDDDEQFIEKCDYYLGYIQDIQYLTEYPEDSMGKVLDMQDPDMMVFEEIGEMLKKKCKINPNSKIYLDINRSFNGNYEEDIDEIFTPEFNFEDLSQELINDINETWDNREIEEEDKLFNN